MINKKTILTILLLTTTTIPTIQALHRFHPTSITTIKGTLDTGNIESIYNPYDTNFYTVYETTGEPGLDIRINFTDVNSPFDQATLRLKLIGGAGHIFYMQIYNFSSNNWVTYMEIYDSETFEQAIVPIPNHSNLISSGQLYIKIVQEEPGNIDHYLVLDSIELEQTENYSGNGITILVVAIAIAAAFFSVITTQKNPKTN
jgi:hypothetical protein